MVLVLALLFGQISDLEMQEALSSVKALPEAERANTRFLSLVTIPKEQRQIAAGVASFVLNSLSDAGAISRPQFATGNLLRFNLRQYSATEEHYKNSWQAWEDLAAVDTVFHQQTQVATESKVKGKVIEPQIRTVTIDAPWLNKDACEELRTVTASIGPILRLEQWLAAVTVPPVYYTMAGVPDTKEKFLASIGLDITTVGKLDTDKGANVVSKVALGRMRRIASYIGPAGHVWETRDVIVVDGARDALRQPLTKTLNPTTQQPAILFKFDAGEWIATRPNGMHVFALFNAEGARQDAVPLAGKGKSIARDFSETHSGFDGVIQPMLSCVRCHTESGLRPLNDVQATLPGIATLPDAQELLSFYNPPQVQLRIKQAREQYDVAVAQACELNAQQVAENLAALVRAYDYDLVTPERAALELGVPLIVLRELLVASSDPYLILLSQGVSIHRDAWRVSYGAAATLLKGGNAKHVADN